MNYIKRRSLTETRTLLAVIQCFLNKKFLYMFESELDFKNNNSNKVTIKKLGLETHPDVIEILKLIDEPLVNKFISDSYAAHST